MAEVKSSFTGDTGEELLPQGKFFTFERLLKRAQKVRGYIDIHDFRLVTLNQSLGTQELFGVIKNWYEENWGGEVEGIVIPLTHHDGVTYDLEGIPKSKKPGINNSLDLAFEALKKGYHVFLSYNMRVTFMDSQGNVLTDITGDTSPALCPVSKFSQQLASYVIGKALLELKERCKQENISDFSSKIGIVLDLTTIFPMGARQNKLELTCFCGECREYLRKSGVNLPKFEKFPSPWNLLLKDEGDGIKPADLPWGDIDELRIIEESKKKGFYYILAGIKKEEVISYAEELLNYITARNEQVKTAIRNILKEIKEVVLTDILSKRLEDNPKVIIVTDGSNLNWTSGIWLYNWKDINSLEGLPVNFWLPPYTIGSKELKNKVNYYMSHRSRYFLNEFFWVVESLTNPMRRASTSLGRLEDEIARTILQMRAKRALAALIKKEQVLSVLHQEVSPIVVPYLEDKKIFNFVSGLVLAPFESVKITDIKNN
jgi:hypothetical protein